MPPAIYCFHDETGEEDMSAGYYMVVMVMHRREDPIDEHIEAYESRLRSSGLEDIPFHAVKLLHGHEGYEGVSPQDRKRMLVAFATVAAHPRPTRSLASPRPAATSSRSSATGRRSS